MPLKGIVFHSNETGLTNLFATPKVLIALEPTPQGTNLTCCRVRRPFAPASRYKRNSPQHAFRKQAPAPL